MLTHRMRGDGLTVTTAGPTQVASQYGTLMVHDLTSVVAQARFGAGVFCLTWRSAGTDPVLPGKVAPPRGRHGAAGGGRGHPVRSTR